MTGVYWEKDKNGNDVRITPLDENMNVVNFENDSAKWVMRVTYNPAGDMLKHEILKRMEEL